MNVAPSLLRTEVIAAARRWIGTPYIHQASIFQAGCDCLGLVRGVWREVMGEEPAQPEPYSPDWAESGGREQMLEAAKQHFLPQEACAFAGGDLLLFRWREGLPIKHAAIATSTETMIHAHDGACVCEVAIPPFWRRRLAATFQFPQRSVLPHRRA